MRSSVMRDPLYHRHVNCFEAGKYAPQQGPVKSAARDADLDASETRGGDSSPPRAA